VFSLLLDLVDECLDTPLQFDPRDEHPTSTPQAADEHISPQPEDLPAVIPAGMGLAQPDHVADM
jgi:hypothetical protein